LRGEGTAEYALDKCDVYLYAKDECGTEGWPDLEEHRISLELVKKLFC
jgi:hypothetical protein